MAGLGAAAAAAATCSPVTVAAEDIAVVYLGLNDKANALRWLERAYAAHSQGLLLLKADPIFSSLTGEGRYQRLLRDLGL